MGCSGSKVVESVREGLESDAGQKASEGIASALLPSEQEALHKDLREKMKANDKHLKKMEKTRQAGGAKEQAATESNRSAILPSSASTTAPGSALGSDATPEGGGDSGTILRGNVASSQKDALRGQYGLPPLPMSSSSARTPLESPRNEKRLESTSDVRSDFVEVDAQRTIVLHEQVLVARRERDAALAEVRRLSGERDAIRADLVYLRAAAEASDHFQDLQRIPPEWVPSEQQRMTQMRERMAALEDEVVVLKHNVRRRLMAAPPDTTGRTSVQGYGPTPLSGSGPYLGADGCSSVSVFEASLNSDFPGGSGGAFLGAASSGSGLPLASIPSPTELVARVSELQMQCRSSERDAQQWEAASRRAREQSQLEAQRLQQEIQTLLHQAHQQREQLEAASARLRGVESEWTRLQQAVDDKRREYEHLEHSIAAGKEAEAAKIERAQEEEEAALRLRALEEAAAKKEDAVAAQFLKQVARLLVNAEHCPDAVRLELLQFVCEHGGLPIDGHATLVVDPSVFDMNGILYGDCLAHLASMVLQRHSCRIETLLLSETAMTDIGVAQLSLTIAVLPFQTSLTHMNLSNNDVTCRGALQLLTALGCASGGTANNSSNNRCGGVIRHRFVVDLDNNPLFVTLEDVKMIMTQVEDMKKNSPAIEVLLPRVPKLEQLSGSAAALARSSSVFAPGTA